MYKKMTLQQGIYNFIGEVKKVKSGLQGIGCKIKEIDSAIQGFRSGEVTFIANTSLRLNMTDKIIQKIVLGIANNLSKNEKGNLLCLCNESWFHEYGNFLQEGIFHMESQAKELDIEMLKQKEKQYNHLPIETYHSHYFSLSQIEKIIKSASMSEIVYINGFYLIDKQGRSDKYVVKKLKQMAIKYNVHIICDKYASVLNKEKFFFIADLFEKSVKPLNYIDNIIEIEDPWHKKERGLSLKHRFKKKNKKFLDEWENKLKLHVIKSNYFKETAEVDLNNC